MARGPVPFGVDLLGGDMTDSGSPDSTRHLDDRNAQIPAIRGRRSERAGPKQQLAHSLRVAFRSGQTFARLARRAPNSFIS